MAGGWTADGAVQDQIDSTVDDAVQRARQALGHGESEHYCQECGREILEARRLALQGVRYCVNCQTEMDKSRPPVACSIAGAAKTASCVNLILFKTRQVCTK